MQPNKNDAAKSRTSIFGNNPLQLNENDAFRLVGSIVEKGISYDQKPQYQKPIPAPKPSVLPFPVARHRSHGPHWGPLENRKNGNDDRGNDDEADAVDKELEKYNQIAAFAGPVQRKEKKGLDFSRYKDIVNAEYSSAGTTERNGQAGKGKKKANEKSKLPTVSLNDVDMYVPSQMNVKPHRNSSKTETETSDEIQRDNLTAGPLSSVTDMEIDNVAEAQLLQNCGNADSSNLKDDPGEIFLRGEDKVGTMSIEKSTSPAYAKTNAVEYVEPGTQKGLEQKSSNFARVLSLTTNESGRGKPTSIENQIDVENLDRLSSMSPEEIAEAQAEIMEKINPNLLKTLQRRGQEKLKKKDASTDVTEENSNALTQEAESSSNDERKISHVATTTCSKDMQGALDNDVDQKSGPAVGSLWDVWSQRVERIREIRFSLDGNVVKSESEMDSGSGQSMYNAYNVAERDILRTEGDPAAAGYTIKEAIVLTRSVIPGQRALALHLLTCVLERALHNICKLRVGSSIRNDDDVNGFVDWEAVWTYALGPEPELVLTLRISLDDNHSSVVLACAKLIQCTLSCDENESYFNLTEKLAGPTKSMCTAPVFRSKPEINVGFLQGGFWKYSAKPSNVIPFGENIVESNTEGERTIQDDIFVAGQDLAAGLVRMGILPRILYLLETDPSVALEECLLSVLIAIARHSPTCANAIMKCERLVQTVVNRFTNKDCMEIHSSKIKTVRLLRALACSDKKYCAEFIKNRTFQNMTWQLYQYRSSLDRWINSGKETCALSSALMVEQLRFWRVCIQYGYGIANFSDLFPALCLWLTPPTFEKVLERNVLWEFASISVEAYLILAALAGKLPNFHAQKNLGNPMAQLAGDDMETWCWSHVGPMVDIALKWLTLNSSHFTADFNDCKGVQNNAACQNISGNPLFWVLSAVMHMLSTVLERIIPDNAVGSNWSGGYVPWLPEFVPRIGLEIIKNRFLNLVGVSDTESSIDMRGGDAVTDILCKRRQQGESETSLACVCCLQGLVRIIISIDKLIHLAKAGIQSPPQIRNSSKEANVLEDGILKWSLVDLRSVQNIFTKLVASEWQIVQSVEKFSRGGPAPGLGVGWGAPGGGFWSTDVLLAQVDAGFLVLLHEIFPFVSVQSLHGISDITTAAQKVNSVLKVCLILGPRDRKTMEKALDILLQVPVLKFLRQCINEFLHRNGKINLLMWDYEEENYQQFSNILHSHYKKRWLLIKKSRSNNKENSRNKRSGMVGESLETIYEDVDTSSLVSQEYWCASLTVEWARQRLPLPRHWFLSPIATIADIKQDPKSNDSSILYQMHDPTEILKIAKAGLFVLLGIEAMSFLIPTDVPAPVPSVTLVWKLHALSVILLVGMGVLEEKESRQVYETLQEIYGQMLHEAWHRERTQNISEQCLKLSSGSEKGHDFDFLRFQADVHESYSTFIETLVEQFSAISYGDIIYGRQVAIYLHRAVEDRLRLATWTTLSNARVLDLLPPIEKCFAGPEGYLEPVEDDEKILEAYTKSWTSGALDRSASRGSISYILVLHHLSSFIFNVFSGDKLSLRNKLVRSLLLDYSQKPQHKGMMMDFIQYKKPDNTQMSADEDTPILQRSVIAGKFEVLVEACKRNSALLTVVEKLRSEVS